MAVIPRQPAGGRLGHRRPQPIHPDLAPQPRAGLLIRDARIGQHRKHQLGDRELVVTVLGPIGQPFGQLVLGLRLLRRDGLVEQLHHLI